MDQLKVPIELYLMRKWRMKRVIELDALLMRSFEEKPSCYLLASNSTKK